MKIILTILLFIGAFTTYAKNGISYRSAVQYTIVSDTYTNDLLSGQVRVKGQVLSPLFEPLAGVLVSTMDEQIAAYTDSMGYYEMIIHDSDTSIFIFKDGFNEVAIARYDFKAGHTVEINFMPTTIAVIDEPSSPPEFISYKPVIYLYSDIALNVSLALDYLGDLTFTYPIYNEGWNVNVDANGIHSVNNDKSYPYLFWEGEMDGLTYKELGGKVLGQIIDTDTLVEYLERQLSAIGLNRTEQTDFITFWVPRMTGKEYVFVQFLVDDLYASEVAELAVSPQPESMKRIYMLFTELDEKPKIEFMPQEFEPFNRNGFTLIEWGGSELTTLTTLEL